MISCRVSLSYYYSILFIVLIILYNVFFYIDSVWSTLFWPLVFVNHLEELWIVVDIWSQFLHGNIILFLGYIVLHAYKYCMSCFSLNMNILHCFILFLFQSEHVRCNNYNKWTKNCSPNWNYYNYNLTDKCTRKKISISNCCDCNDYKVYKVKKLIKIFEVKIPFILVYLKWKFINPNNVSKNKSSCKKHGWDYLNRFIV